MEKIKNYIEFRKLFKNITEKFVRDLDITLIEAAEYSIIEFEIYLSEYPEDSTFIFTAWAIYLLERVHSLRSRTPKKAKATICRLVLNLRSQFFQSRLFFSNQEKLRSTTHRFGNTAKRCNSFRLAISTSAPINSCTDEANALPV